MAIKETTRGAGLTSPLPHFPSTPIVQIFKSVRSESSGPYAIEFQPYEHAKFVAVLRGSFDLQIAGEATSTRIQQGDCYLLGQGQAYRICNAEVPATDATTLFSSNRGADGVVRWGNGVADTITVGCRASFNPAAVTWLREWVPPLIRMPAGSAEAVCFAAILSLLCSETEGAPGGPRAVDNYVALLLIHAWRHLRKSACHNTLHDVLFMISRQPQNYEKRTAHEGFIFRRNATPGVTGRLRAALQIGLGRPAVH